MTAYTVSIAVVLSLATYLLIARLASRDNAADPEKYYLARNSVGADQLAVASTAYQLQMGTIYPFFTLALGGLWWIAGINLLFYFFGIVALVILLPRFSGHAIDLLGSSATVHDAIARLHDVRFLRPLTAAISMVAFAGLAVFELVWGGRALKVALGGGDFIYYVTISILAVYLILYVWMGGQTASIGADQYQLVYAYLGLHLLVAWALLQNGQDIAMYGFPPILLIVLVYSLVMLTYRIGVARKIRAAQASSAGLPSARTLWVLNLVTMVSLCAMAAAIVRAGALPAAVRFNPEALASIVRDPSFPLIAVSVSCLPLFFQFVDMTTWQRFAGLRAEHSDRTREARRTLGGFLIESPLSWLLPIVLGFAASQMSLGGGDPWQALLSKVIAEPAPWAPVFAALVFVGIVAVFMSTADAMLTAVGYAWAYDVSSVGRRQTNSPAAIGARSWRDGRVRSGRRAMAVTATCVVAVFIALDLAIPSGGDRFLGLFLSLFAMLSALAPSVVLPALTGRTAQKYIAVASLIGGAGAGLLLGIASAFSPGMLNGQITWWPPVVAFVLSWAIYFFGLIFFGRRIGQRDAPEDSTPGEPAGVRGE